MTHKFFLKLNNTATQSVIWVILIIQRRRFGIVRNTTSKQNNCTRNKISCSICNKSCTCSLFNVKNFEFIMIMPRKKEMVVIKISGDNRTL